MTIRDSALRNGYSAYHGGNLYLGKTNVTLENTEIYAGVAVNRGGNIYGTSDWWNWYSKNEWRKLF